MKKVKFFEVVSCYDKTINHVAYFEQIDHANTLSESNAFFSLKKEEPEEIVIYSSVEEYESEHSRQRKIKKALSKLTIEDREVLGLE